LNDIGTTLGADLKTEIFLGQRATEKNVKSNDLAAYRVVAFATHGLVPGDLRGLDQPSLALSNPALTDDSDNDGFLTMSEVLGIKLNADWVVLSACNTASGDGQSEEAVSGLGRAFFFAGSRRLLVSYWPVETVSARLLTTELFKRQAVQPEESKAEALRHSMLKLMSGSQDYSHPAFWAPFGLIGDAAR
jgi:CHAT domain-containing protein